MSSDPQGGRGPKASFFGPRLMAIAFLLLGVLILVQSFAIRQASGYSPVGTRFFPLLVAAGTLGLSVLFLLRTTVIPDHDLAVEAAAEDATTDWPTVGLTALALLLYPFALDRLGYVLATALFFPATARVLGSHRIARDVLIGLGLALVIFVGFTRFLGVRLPAGLLELFF